MIKGVPWEDRSWTPRVGMKIRYRRDIKPNQHHDFSLIAEIVEVRNDESIRIRRDSASRVKYTSVSKQVWRKDWEPVPEEKPLVVSVNSGLTEADVRRIVREELAAVARKVESATKLFLDDLFDAI